MSEADAEFSDPDDGMIEPVHWGARLVVADDARYTEVGGAAVAVLAAQVRIVQVTGDMAALVTRLDGRPVRDALAELLSGWDDAERRRVIELLRRCKTLGLLRDAPAGASPHSVDWSTPVPPAETFTVRATLEPAPVGDAGRAESAAVDGGATGASAGAVRVVLAPSRSDDVSGRPEVGGREDEPVVAGSGLGRVILVRGGRGVVTVRGDETEHEVAAFVLPPDESAAGLLAAGSADAGAGRDAAAAQASDAFGILVESVDPRDQLRDPAIVEACAVSAETIPAHRRVVGV